MNNTTKHALTAIVATISLTALSMSARGDDQTTPPAPIVGGPSTTPEFAAQPLQLEQPAPVVEDKDKWSFTSPLLFWFPALKGSATAKGRTADVDLDMGDIANHTDVGWVAFFDLSKDRFGVYVQPNYLKISGDAKSGGTSASLETQLWIVETAAHYNFWEWGGDYHGSLAGVGGLRWWQVHNDLKVKNPTASAGETTSLYDPFFGLLYNQYYTPKFHVRVQADVGGFDLGRDTSRFAWQVWPLLGYDFTMPVIKKPSTFFAGYRLLDSQHHTGSGANEQGYHLLFHGVTVGFNVMLF